MKVAVYYSNDDIRIEERPVPSISDGEILVRMMASGICGTDVMQWYRQKRAPRVLGHEMAGEVVGVGRGVEGFRVGDRVFVSHHVPCYRCHYCLDGNYTACESLHEGNYDPGGFSEYIRVPEPNVRFGTFMLPEGMTYEEATMIEPLACVILGQRQIGIKEGHTVLVIGAGVSGLLHIRIAKLKGAAVIASDVNEYKLRKAIELGADHVFDATGHYVDNLRDVTSGWLPERVIVCAGVKQAVDDAMSSVDRKGRILFFAVPEGYLNIQALRFWRDEITATSSYGAAPADLKEAMELLQHRTVNVRGMITHRIPLSDIQRGFRLASEARESLKVVIVPDEAL